MGMAITESLKWLISRKEHYEMDDNCQELAQALDDAISIMRKYQTIEQIKHRVKHTDLEPAKAYELINEVMIEDGEID